MNFIWPLDDHIITRDFYYKSSLYVGGQHAALDLIPRSRPATGEPVRAVADWVAVGVGWDMYSGFFVALDHAGGFRSWYRHLYGQSPVVVGQQGKQGDIIGNIGNTGYSLGAHLHFDLWNHNKIRDDNAIFFKNDWYAVDPIFYLGQEEDEMTDVQMETLLKEMRSLAKGLSKEMHELVARLALDLTKIKNHQAASDGARDSHVTQQADRVIAALSQISGGVSKEVLKQAIREIVAGN